MGEWKEYKLGDVIQFGNGKERPKTEGEIPVFGGNGILGFCNQSNYKDETIIIGRVGAYCGSVFYQNKPIWVSDNALAAKPKNNFHTKFLYYLLKNLQLNNFAEGSSHPLVTQTLLNSLEVSVTDDLPEQKSIASILSSLDDKIDLLHRQNKTLEALAETLFRQWFVEEAEEGWEEKGLDEIAEFINGLACQKYPPVAGVESLPVIKIKELRAGITEATDMARVDVPEKYIINDGDILFSWSGSLEVVIWSHGKGVLNQHLFKVSSEQYPEWFFYFWIKHHLPDFRNIAQDKATTMGHIQRHHLSDAIVVIPSPDKMIFFNAKIKPMFDKIKQNLIQIRTLTRLRDTLLPKLMSGEVRVKE